MKRFSSFAIRGPTAAVAVELAVILRIRYRYLDPPLLSAAFKVPVGGVLVFLAGILIGSS